MERKPDEIKIEIRYDEKTGEDRGRYDARINHPRDNNSVIQVLRTGLPDENGDIITEEVTVLGVLNTVTGKVRRVNKRERPEIERLVVSDTREHLWECFEEDEGK